jgi:isopentenyl-diphosphate delta-isomerase type 1
MPNTELVDLVDINDRVVGAATVGSCLENGLLHRAVAVLVVRGEGRFLLQQRSRNDIWHPGLWTISCTGHVKQGETYEIAARRELLEELGLSAWLTKVKKYLLPPISAGRLTEREWVVLFTCHTDSKYNADSVELEAVREVSKSQLRYMMDKGPMTPDAKIILDDFLASGSKLDRST